jgi:acyl carrier protein
MTASKPAMTRTDILRTLLALARKTFDEDDLAFDESTAFEDIDDWDSMNHVHMVVAMEKAFSVRFGIGELQRVVRVADLIDIIERARAQ